MAEKRENDGSPEANGCLWWGEKFWRQRGPGRGQGAESRRAGNSCAHLSLPEAGNRGILHTAEMDVLCMAEQCFAGLRCGG